MLQADCDIAATKDFERNFDSTYIGEHKTPLANTFRVMHLDFPESMPIYIRKVLLQMFETDRWIFLFGTTSKREPTFYKDIIALCPCC